jgi:hypothetical protein
MYSFLSSVETVTVKTQIREQIFSLLGNTGKTLFSENTYIYTQTNYSWYNQVLNTLVDIWNTPYKKLLTYL